MNLSFGRLTVAIRVSTDVNHQLASGMILCHVAFNGPRCQIHILHVKLIILIRILTKYKRNFAEKLIVALLVKYNSNVRTHVHKIPPWALSDD
jgi:hypothetical protein